MTEVIDFILTYIIPIIIVLYTIDRNEYISSIILSGYLLRNPIISVFNDAADKPEIVDLLLAYGLIYICCIVAYKVSLRIDSESKLWIVTIWQIVYYILYLLFRTLIINLI